MRLTNQLRSTRHIILGLRAFVAAHRKVAVCLICLACVVCLSGAWRIRNQARARLAEQREQLARQDLIPFERKMCSPLKRADVQIRQSTKSVRDLTRFQDSYFATTDGGLVQLSPAGELLRHYTVLDGLPESDLTSLATFGARLFIGTRSRGLVAFDGERFESFHFTDRDPQATSALLVAHGRLLIGTFAGGLIEFDGQQFRELRAGAEQRQRILKINCLVKAGARLYVGTFADGLWLAEGGRWLHFTTDDGLLSNRIVGVVASGESVFVATDFGLSVAPGSDLLNDLSRANSTRFQARATLPSLSGLVESQSQLLLVKDDGALFTLDADSKSARGAQLKLLAWRKPDELSTSRLIMLDGAPALLTSAGIWRANVDDALKAHAPSAATIFGAFGQSVDARAPSSNLISALAFDEEGRLWAGTFRDGLELFNADGTRAAHILSDTAREINALVPDKESKTMLAATSQGVVRFDASLRSTRLMHADGLLSNAVSQVALAPLTKDGTAATRTHEALLWCATSRGLSLVERGRARGLTTVQGLPSNSLYAVLPHGRTVFVATLSGLAEIEANKVVRVFKDSNSNLTHNWTTALAAAGERLFIGTYGGGVFELTPSGELRSFKSEMGAAFVNPNAMWSDGSRLYVGTLDGAWVYELGTQKWMHLKDELPSNTVLSITGDERHVYFGTTSGIARIEKNSLT